MKRLPLARIAGRIFGTPLAMEESGLRAIVSSLGPRILGFSYDDDGDNDTEEDDSPSLTTMTDDGIAVINIAGTLVSQSSWINSLCGLVSYPDISAAFFAAMADPRCLAIVLNIDSPGGEVSGLFDLTDQMAAARGSKPFVACVNDVAASGGYALAATADRIIVPQTGIAGSIGVLSIHVDQTALDANRGLKYTAVYAGDRKNDGNPHEALTAEAYSAMKSRVDQINDIFTASVSRDRRIDVKTVKAMQAALYMGDRAVQAGLADQMGTLDDALTAARTAVGRQTSSAAAAANLTKEPRTMAEPNAAETGKLSESDVKKLVAEAQTAGYASAAEVADLCMIAGHPELIAGFVRDKKEPADVRKALIDLRAKSQEAEELRTGVMPGADSPQANQGKPKPWKEVLSALGFGKRGK